MRELGVMRSRRALLTSSTRKLGLSTRKLGLSGLERPTSTCRRLVNTRLTQIRHAHESRPQLATDTFAGNAAKEAG